MPVITINKEAKEVIIITEDHGGYKEGYCFACGVSGWIDGYGYPHNVKDVPGSHLKHELNCPMSSVLKEDGNLKESKEKRKCALCDEVAASDGPLCVVCVSTI